MNIWQNNPKKTFVFSCVCDRVFWQSSAHDLRYADSTGHVSNEEEEEVLTGGGLEAVSVGGMFCSFLTYLLMILLSSSSAVTSFTNFIDQQTSWVNTVALSLLLLVKCNTCLQTSA